ncbi:MAG: hypothetical protein IKL28_05345 [Lachnospiraceae bacterium]|nr:hypothetical protein [Lachnospiraceae bacterium]
MIVKDIDGIERDICSVRLGVRYRADGMTLAKDPYLVLGVYRIKDGEEENAVLGKFSDRKVAAEYVSCLLKGVSWHFKEYLVSLFVSGAKTYIEEVDTSGRK